MTAKHPKPSPPDDAPFHPLDPRGARQRLLYAAIVGAVAWLVIPSRLALTVRVLATWSVAAIALLAIAGWIITRSDAAETGRRAASHDPGRTVVWILVLGASAFSLFGATVVVHQTAKLTSVGDDLVLVLCVASVAVSWLLTHTAFTLRYAHLYYRVGGNEKVGGLEFPGGEAPDDLDFAYFAFTIGMCFQVSDATVSNRIIRRTVLAHAMLSFAYNTFIIALALNLVTGHLS